MKPLHLILITFLVSVNGYGQEQVHDFERKNYYELQGRANFYEINNRYEIFKDTIYYSITGFLVNTDWDEVSIDNIIYIVLTYPNFLDGKQSSGERS